jgi:hypothetical protein
MLMALLAAAALTTASRQVLPETAAVGVPDAPVTNSRSVLPEGTPIRLMILREINSRTAKVGDRFKLRVDEPVFIDGKAVVPVGSTAWGEVSLVQQNGPVGKGGKLSLNLLYLELPAGHVPLRGDYSRKGDGNSAGVVLAVVGFGLPGLLMAGDSGRLKAGDTFTGYVTAGSTVAPSTFPSAEGKTQVP